MNVSELPAAWCGDKAVKVPGNSLLTQTIRAGHFPDHAIYCIFHWK
jgi:hypothetical protein